MSSADGESLTCAKDPGGSASISGPVFSLQFLLDLTSALRT